MIITRGAIAGTAVLVAGYVVWGAAIYTQRATPIWNLVFLLVPAIAGFVATWMAPREQRAPMVILAIPAALLAGIVNLLLQAAGSDVGVFVGVTGALRVAFYTLLWSGLFSMVGGLLAVIARQVRGAA